MPTVIKKLDPNTFQLKDQVVAINRVTKVVKGGKNMSFAALVVVGDTPRDVEAAHAAGAVAVGVATGRSSRDELHAAGAEHVFDDLSDPRRLVAGVRSTRDDSWHTTRGGA